MSVFFWHNPVRTIFGPGTLSTLPEVVGKRRVLVLTFRSAQDSGLLARLRSLLGERIVELIDAVPSQPQRQWVAQLHERVWAKPDFDAIVAVGGGSVLDLGKALSCQPASGKFEHLFQEQCPVAQRRPLIAVPTTAGTGSEVTPFSIIWNGPYAKPAKQTMFLPELWPETAIVDPELSLSLPQNNMRDAALDALSHALEALWSRKASPMTDSLAIQAARGILAALPRVWRYPGDFAARTELSLAALRSGMCIAHTRTALAHALSYAVTAAHGVPHGLACSFSLPWVWRLAQGHDARRDAMLAQVFGVADKDPASSLEKFLHQLDVSTEFTDYGLVTEGAVQFAAYYATTPQGADFIANPLPVTES